MKNFFYLYIFIWLVAVFALTYFGEFGFAIFDKAGEDSKYY